MLALHTFKPVREEGSKYPRIFVPQEPVQKEEGPETATRWKKQSENAPLSRQERVAVFTIDEVNYHEIALNADRHNLRADQIFPKEKYPKGIEYVLDIYDLDYLVETRTEREKFVKRLARKVLLRPTIVQSYHLDDDQITRLENNGIIVVRHIKRDTIARALGLAVEEMKPAHAA